MVINRIYNRHCLSTFNQQAYLYFALALSGLIETANKAQQQPEKGLPTACVSTVSFQRSLLIIREAMTLSDSPELLIACHTAKESIQNTWKQRSKEITKSTDNTLITSYPEDIFNIIHAQLNVAKEKLPQEYVKEVAIACFQVLQDVQRQSYDTLQHNLTSLDAKTLCAIVNDNQRMEEKCREFTDEMLLYVRDYEERDMLDGNGNEVATEFLLIANQAVKSISRQV